MPRLLSPRGFQLIPLAIKRVTLEALGSLAEKVQSAMEPIVGFLIVLPSISKSSQAKKRIDLILKLKDSTESNRNLPKSMHKSSKLRLI